MCERKDKIPRITVEIQGPLLSRITVRFQMSNFSAETALRHLATCNYYTFRS